MPPITTPAPRDGVHVTYQTQVGSGQLFEFSPAPFIQCDRAIDFSGKEQHGQTITINVTGTLVAPKHLDDDGIRVSNDKTNVDYVLGQQGMSPLERQRRIMEQVLSVPGGEFRIYCICGANEDCTAGTQVTYFKCYPEMIGTISFQTSSDNWTQTIPYTFQMVVHKTDLFNKDGTPIYLDSIDENWSIEYIDEKTHPDIQDYAFENLDGCTTVMRLTHTLTATGKKIYGEQVFDTPRGKDQSLHGWRNQDASGEIGTIQDWNTLERFVPVNAKPPYQHAKEWIETRLRKTTIAYNDWHETALSVNKTLDNVQLAQDRPEYNIGSNNDFFYLDDDGIFNFNVRKKAFNHIRQKTGNEVAGTYSVTESWIILVSSGEFIDYGAIDDYTVGYNHNRDTGIDTVTVEGTITGYQEGNIDDPQDTKKTKIFQAETLLKRLMRSNSFYRRASQQVELIHYSRVCETLHARGAIDLDSGGTREQEEARIQRLIDAEGIGEPCLNIIPVSKSIRKQTSDGVITYTYEFNSKRNNIFHDTLSESFTTSITYPTDVFTNVIIPGRQRGPLFFSANTYQVTKYTLNYDMVLMPECSNSKPIKIDFFDDSIVMVNNQASSIFDKEVDHSLQRRLQSDMNGKRKCRAYIIMVARTHYNYIQEALGKIIRIESDNDSWDASERRYSGSLTFVFGQCSGSNLISLTKAFKNHDQGMVVNL